MKPKLVVCSRNLKATACSNMEIVYQAYFMQYKLKEITIFRQRASFMSLCENLLMKQYGVLH